MTDLITKARQRMAELEAELDELRNFVAVADRLASGEPGPITLQAVPRLRSTKVGDSHMQPFRGSSPKEIVVGLHAVLSESGEVLDRDALIGRLEQRKIVVPGMYPNKNLGTILWRNQRLFEHLQGKGYRWTGEPLEEPKPS